MRAMIATLLLASSLFFGVGEDPTLDGRFLYILSNNNRFDQNSIVAYVRGEDGTLTPHPMGSIPTRGTGIDNSTNGKLGPNDNDTPLAMSTDKKWLFAVNGNSNTIAALEILRDGSLRHVDGSPFDSMGIGPVSIAISNDTLVVANRNEDPHQLSALRSLPANFASFRIGADGSLSFLSKVEVGDGHKPTQALVARADGDLIFGNDFRVDVDFDGDGTVSRLFDTAPAVVGRIESLRLSGGILRRIDNMELPETVQPAPEVPTVPLGIWDHPTKRLLYVGLVTRNQLGVFRYGTDGRLGFVAAVPNSGQDICWLRVNEDGTRLYAVNNLPREDQGDAAGTLTVFDISGDRAEEPVEIQRLELPLPMGTFVNNRNIPQPNSTPFQLTLDPEGRFVYVINQRIDQTAGNLSPAGNVLHTLRVKDGGLLEVIDSRRLESDGVDSSARPQGIVTLGR